MATIDIISDLHLDFWVAPITTKSYKTLKTFLLGLLPDKPSDVLLIAGDIGHHNYQNEQAFKVFAGVYKHVCWVYGNHDLYMISHDMKKKFKKNSMNRLNDMIKRSNRIPNVHYLDGNVIELEGIRIGGVGGWYDYSFGLNNFNKIYTKQMIHKKWQGYMNDYNFIYCVDSNNKAIPFAPLKFAKKENAKFKKVIDGNPDVILSHVGPCHGKLSYSDRQVLTSFYYFDGEDYLYNLDSNNTWLYGHTHYSFDYEHPMGCRMITNALGYPSSIRGENNKIKTINI